jgi:hypothetical protein
MSGQRVGALLVTPETVRDARGCLRWVCVCDCGQQLHVTGSELRAGHRTRCLACSKEQNRLRAVERGFGKINVRHGHTACGTGRTKEYRAWLSMKARCSLPSQRSFVDYGARGIKVCDRWMASYEDFLADVGLAPSPSHTIEREDSNRNYEPGNVRWATRAEQSRNRRNNIVVEIDGLSLTLGEWAERAGIPYRTVWARINVLKWPPERALAR